MNVKLVASTDVENVLEFVGEIAGICYGKNDPKEQRAINCAKNGHASVFEHVQFTFKLDGISRACSHQLVRHRMASYTQESQRYVKIDTSVEDWYVMPPEFADDEERERFFHGVMRYAGMNYSVAINCGMKAEDARYMLPNAAKTNMFVTMNLRELWHFLKLRSSSRAQWEIRTIAIAMWEAVLMKHPELYGFEINE